MRFSGDHHFLIGEQHLRQGKPCQDYALAETGKDATFALVSDGCSSGGHTDVGARLVVLSTASAIRHLWATSSEIPIDISVEVNMHKRILLQGSYRTLELKWEDMLATCLYLHLTAKGGLAIVQGDGVVARRLKNGLIYMFRVEWPNNLPFYPIYSEDNYESFVKAHGGDVDAHIVRCEEWLYDPSNGFEQKWSVDTRLSHGIHGPAYNLEDPLDLSFAAVFSDGVNQVEGLDWKDVVVELMSFKSTAGEFAKRRMISATKEMRKKGQLPMDDLSYAVIQVHHDEPEKI